MRVLTGCEKSGVVRNAFAALGHDAWSCDLEPSDSPGNHMQCDIKTVLEMDWDLIILFPECTAMCVSGNHVYACGKPRWRERLKAVKWTYNLWLRCVLVADYVAMENPVGVLPTLTRVPQPQFIQPYEFGHNASKKTGLFLHELPTLQPTKTVQGRMIMWNGTLVERWDNQTDSGQNKLGPSDDRAEVRGRTYPGIAAAMAEQWSLHISSEEWYK